MLDYCPPPLPKKGREVKSYHVVIATALLCVFSMCIGSFHAPYQGLAASVVLMSVVYAAVRTRETRFLTPAGCLGVVLVTVLAVAATIGATVTYVGRSYYVGLWAPPAACWPWLVLLLGAAGGLVVIRRRSRAKARNAAAPPTEAHDPAPSASFVYR